MMNYCARFLLLLLLLLCARGSIGQPSLGDSLSTYRMLDSLVQVEGENDPSTALTRIARMEVIAKQLNIDTLFLEVEAIRGEVFVIFGFTDMAIKGNYAVLKKAEELHLPGYQARVLYNLGLIAQNSGEFAQSSIYFSRAKQMYIAAKDWRDTVAANYELAFNMVAMGKVDEGTAMMEHNLNVAKMNHDDNHIVLGLDNLSNISLEVDKPEKAILYQREIFNYPGGFASNYRKAGVYEHLTEVFVVMKKWDSAAKYLEEAFKYTRLIRSDDWLVECYRMQAAICEGRGDYKGALEAKTRNNALKDSLTKRNNESKVAAIVSLYDLERKKAEVAVLEKDKLASAARLRQQQLQKRNIVLGALLLLALVASAFLLWMHRRTRVMQQAFSRSLIQGQEDERQRISRELHDSVGQNILFIKNQLSANDGAALAPVMQTITATIEDVRNISKDLYPNQLEKYGLAAAIDALAERVQQATGIFMSADLANVDEQLSREARINLFRMVQEAVNNVVKHANAKAIRVTGHAEKGKAVLDIQDNGKGFDIGILAGKAQSSYGLLNMEERARMLGGKFAIQSSSAGTRITITIPLPHDN